VHHPEAALGIGVVERISAVYRLGHLRLARLQFRASAASLGRWSVMSARCLHWLVRVGQPLGRYAVAQWRILGDVPTGALGEAGCTAFT
jgi:hypothetical protein